MPERGEARTTPAGAPLTCGGLSQHEVQARGSPDAADRAQHRAVELALRLLNRRERSVEEVRRHLERKGVEPEAVDAAVARLAELGYLDDAALARRFAEDRRALDGWGRERIGRRLRALGVEPDALEAALGERDEDVELEAALAVLERRVSPPTDDRARRRALGLLERRGYDRELALRAVRSYATGDAGAL